jgi:hypothetical protein
MTVLLVVSERRTYSPLPIMPPSSGVAARTLNTLVSLPILSIHTRTLAHLCVGLFAPSAGQHLKDEQRRRRSQFDRGTSLAEREEFYYDDGSIHSAYRGYLQRESTSLPLPNHELTCT